MKNQKAPVDDGVVIEAIKVEGRHLINKIEKIFNPSYGNEKCLSIIFCTFSKKLSIQGID